jgi:hypothetical protein
MLIVWDTLFSQLGLRRRRDAGQDECKYDAATPSHFMNSSSEKHPEHATRAPDGGWRLKLRMQLELAVDLDRHAARQGGVAHCRAGVLAELGTP